MEDNIVCVNLGHLEGVEAVVAFSTMRARSYSRQSLTQEGKRFPDMCVAQQRCPIWNLARQEEDRRKIRSCVASKVQQLSQGIYLVTDGE